MMVPSGSADWVSCLVEAEFLAYVPVCYLLAHDDRDPDDYPW